MEICFYSYVCIYPKYKGSLILTVLKILCGIKKLTISPAVKEMIGRRIWLKGSFQMNSTYWVLKHIAMHLFWQCLMMWINYTQFFFKRSYRIPMLVLVTLINHQLIIIILRSPKKCEDCFEALGKYIYHIIIHFSSCLPSHYVHNIINYVAVVVAT